MLILRWVSVSSMADMYGCRCWPKWWTLEPIRWPVTHPRTIQPPRNHRRDQIRNIDDAAARNAGDGGHSSNGRWKQGGGREHRKAASKATAASNKKGHYGERPFRIALPLHSRCWLKRVRCRYACQLACDQGDGQDLLQYPTHPPQVTSPLRKGCVSSLSRSSYCEQKRTDGPAKHTTGDALGRAIGR